LDVSFFLQSISRWDILQFLMMQLLVSAHRSHHLPTIKSHILWCRLPNKVDDVT
jgi:hypothetical protein